MVSIRHGNQVLMIERNEPMRFGHKVMTTVAASILTLGAAPALAASASTTHPVASHAVTLPATSPACGQGFVRISGSQSTNGEYQEETGFTGAESRSEEHTSELQSL